ncbi:MAG: YihY family inner membrane protein [Burkholderiales bacterium]|nr:YihY family inner membrane protein [Burkholderiales bacterium]
MHSDSSGPPRWEARAVTVLATLRSWPWLTTLRALRRRFREDRLAVTAGSLTFTTLIALVPLLTVMLAVFTAFPMFSGFEASLNKYFLQHLVPDNIARPVLMSLTMFAAKARRIGAVGVLLLAVTALALALTIDRTLNDLWRVRKPRPLAQRLLVYWAGISLGPLALGVSLSLTSYVLSASRGLVSALPGGLGVLLELSQFLIFAAATAALFHFVPNTTVRWRHAWAGGLFVALAFELAKRGLAWYVQTVPTYAAVYGAFATVPILLLWIYFGWVIMLMGASIAADAPGLEMRVARLVPTPGWRFELALAALRLLAAARQGTPRGRSLAELAERMQVDPVQLEPVLDLLVAMDWVARLEETGAGTAGPRHVLLCDPAVTLLAPLADRLLLAPGPASQAFRRRAGLDAQTLAEGLAGPGPD